jgi:hypothetical protein
MRSDRPCRARLAAPGLAAAALAAACAHPRAPAAVAAPARPTPQVNRAAEDWSALADPALRTEPLDALKYIALSRTDPATYLSLGLVLRERLESTSAPLFGVNGAGDDTYHLHRLQLHADLHLDARWNVFVQLEDVRALAKDAVGPADANPADLRQAFVMYQRPLGPGVLRARIGRQEVSFDLQRFISLRDGANVQQGFDAAWIAWDTPTWGLRGFASLPVDHQHDHGFDDTSSFDHRLGLVRLERAVGPRARASVFYARLVRPRSAGAGADLVERRDVIDLRFGGTHGGLDWDAEAMVQTGDVGARRIRAWATGARLGYAIRPPLATRIGIQVDTATGDANPDDDTAATFTPLVANGYYFTLASATGYANLIHVKPSISWALSRDLLASAALGLQWRETTADAIYAHPLVAIAGSAGQPGAWTGGYLQLRTEAKLGPSLVIAGEIVHFQAGAAIRAVGGGTSDFVAIEARLAW